jgi:hypothetical protein
MSKLTSNKIDSISNFAIYIDEAVGHRKKPNNIWYRGEGKSTFSLLPRLYRNPRNIVDLVSKEETMAKWFYERSIPYCVRDLKDHFEKLFFMQHYGVPTRLLDWTENPFIALYFALKPDPKYIQNDSVVWVLDPCLWNKEATKSIGKPIDQILFKDDPENRLISYTLGKPLLGGELLPLAVYGTYNSYRIAAQRGVFTIFGSTKDPMEKYFIDSRRHFNKSCLTKIIIPYSLKQKLFKSLLSLGITESTILPDLDGLARESRRTFGFED